VIRRCIAFCRNILQIDRVERELEEELRSYVELVVQEKVQSGADLQKAWCEARKELGGFEQLKDSVRDARTGAFMDSLIKDLRFGARSLAKNPGFALTAIVALALGIGPNTAIFSVVYANLLAPLPYANPDQLVMVWSKAKGARNQVAAADFLDWRRQATSFSEVAAFVGQAYNLSSASEPQYTQGERVSPNWFHLLGDKPQLGRDFRADEEQPGKNHVFILSHRCWVARFGADQNILGKQVYLNGEPYTAIGVMPPGPWDRHNEELWVPLSFSPAELARGATFWYVIGRLKPGVSLPQAQQEMDAVTHRIGELYPTTNKGWSASVEPLKNDFQSPNTRMNLWLLLAAVDFVLLIACVNVANLLLARGHARRKEFAVRKALGASRGRLLRQLIVESLVLAGLGGALGAALSMVLLRGILTIVPPGTLSSEADVRLSIPVLLFTLVTTLIAGLLFGCAPVLQAGTADVNESLKQGGRSAVGSGRSGVQHTLVVVEFALAFTLLISAAFTIHSFINRTHIDLGVRTDHVLTFNLPVPQSKLPTPAITDSFYREVLARLEAIPGVSAAAAATSTPLEGADFDMPFRVVGRTTGDPSLRPEAGFQAVTPRFFKVFGIRLERGRAFTAYDTASSLRVAMVNETFVHRFLADADPLLQTLRIEELRNGILALGPPVEWRVVGVFHDVQNNEQLGMPNRPEIYVPFSQSPWPHALLAVWTERPPESVIGAVRAAIRSMDRNLPLANVKTMQQIVRDRFVEDRFGTALYGSFAGVALLLACVGIYGVFSFAVAQRTSEIGLRMAFGATPRQILLRILRKGLQTAIIGLMFGCVGTYFVERAMRAMLYQTSSFDWQSLAAVSCLLLFAACLASYVPARRASALDPMIALRDE
jgi:putative ABC transport system permease protein